jgi:hypothetical protein
MLKLFYKYFQGKADQNEERAVMDYAESSEEAFDEYLRERRLYDAFLFNSEEDEKTIV